jgi:hypothetical protein
MRQLAALFCFIMFFSACVRAPTPVHVETQFPEPLPTLTPPAPEVTGCDLTDVMGEGDAGAHGDAAAAYALVVERLQRWDAGGVIEGEEAGILCFHDEETGSYHFEIVTCVDSGFGPPGTVLREGADGGVVAIPSEGYSLGWQWGADTLVQRHDAGQMLAFLGPDMTWHDATGFDEAHGAFVYHHPDTNVTYTHNSQTGGWEIDPEAIAMPASVRAGFRYSTYGPERDPGPAYWAYVGEEMAARFPDATPQAVWIVAEHQADSQTARLSFPGESAAPHIAFSDADGNEAALALFDERGIEVWLQVEPMSASVDALIRMVLDRYGHHPCVVGVGVDVEWYDIANYPDGRPVTDEEALAWLALVQSYNADYRIFLKHWLANRMPPTAREGIVFVNDAQRHPSFEAMLDLFAAWGEAFAPAPAAFQYGYEGDRDWWDEFADPPGDVGAAILAAVPTTEALFWVDFSVLSVFPPEDAGY